MKIAISKSVERVAAERPVQVIAVTTPMLEMLDATFARRVVASVHHDQIRTVLILLRTLFPLALGGPGQCRSRSLMLKKMILKSLKRNKKRRRKRKRRRQSVKTQAKRSGRKRQTVTKTNLAMMTVTVIMMRRSVQMILHGLMPMGMVVMCIKPTSHPKLFLVRKRAIMGKARQRHIAATHATLALQFTPRPLAETKFVL